MRYRKGDIVTSRQQMFEDVKFAEHEILGFVIHNGIEFAVIDYGSMHLEMVKECQLMFPNDTAETISEAYAIGDFGRSSNFKAERR